MGCLSSRSIVVGFVFLSACGGKSSGPAAPSPGAAAPSPASPTAIRLEGPSSLAPGTSAQYRVVASFPDGTTGDVTSASSIHSRSVGMSAADVLQVTSSRVTGAEQGEADLVAYYPAAVVADDTVVILPRTLVAPRLRVVVLEPGTFRVSGFVTESGLPFPGIEVVVVAGRRVGVRAHTDSNGQYFFYGLAGPTELAVSVEGFQTLIKSTIVTDHQTVDFSLQPLLGYDSLSGDWQLTLLAAPSCRTEIPSDATSRTIHARITQRGPQLTFELSSSARVILPDYMSTGHGGVSGNDVTLYLQQDAERQPPRWVLLEMLDPRRFLGIAGSAWGRRSGNTVTGTLSGYFSVYRSTGANYLDPTTVLESSCFRKIGIHTELHAFRLDRLR